MGDELLPVTQADREAAAALYLDLEGPPYSPKDLAEAASHQTGVYDAHPAVRAFARHRIEHTRPEATRPDAVEVEKVDPRWTALANAQAAIVSLEARLERSNKALSELDEACRRADALEELYWEIDGSLLDEAKAAVAWKGLAILIP